MATRPRLSAQRMTFLIFKESLDRHGSRQRHLLPLQPVDCRSLASLFHQYIFGSWYSSEEIHEPPRFIRQKAYGLQSLQVTPCHKRKRLSRYQKNVYALISWY